MYAGVTLMILWWKSPPAVEPFDYCG
jgi:hypothetical protein